MSTPDSASAIVPTNKIHYIDHLKVVLTALVVLHHAFVTYGAPGGWYYSEKTTIEGALIPMTILVSVNQAFFMGFSFFYQRYLFHPLTIKKVRQSSLQIAC